MILHLEGDINRYYVETLCLIFFPGSTFGENEEKREGIPEVTVNVYKEEDKAVTAYVSIKLNDRICEATESVPLSQEVAIATHSSIAVGRAIFAAGKEMLGHIPPWGILTGVRPAKVAATLMKGGNGILKTKRILRDEYFLNPQKAALAVSVATNENKIVKKLPQNICSLYISIPFCPSRCAYCSFVSYTTPKLLSLVDEYIDALLLEIEEKIKLIKLAGLELVTIYIGGGTPTTLTVKQLTRLFKKLWELVDIDSLLEFTLEAGRPDTITEEKLLLAKKYGVTRISVNPQTLNDDVLREIGRKHSVEDFYKAFEIAKRSGIKDINVDVIAGLPNDDFKSFSETIDKIIELAPTNITVHTFTVKKAADVLRNNSSVYSINATDAIKGVSYAQLKTKFAGYKPYYMYRQKNTVSNLENVGFALEGHEGIYNVFMMEDIQTIFGVGAGAVTKLYRETESGENKLQRIFNQKYPYEYLKAAKERNLGNANDSLSEKVSSFFNIK